MDIPFFRSKRMSVRSKFTVLDASMLHEHVGVNYPDDASDT